MKLVQEEKKINVYHAHQFLIENLTKELVYHKTDFSKIINQSLDNVILIVKLVTDQMKINV